MTQPGPSAPPSAPSTQTPALLTPTRVAEPEPLAGSPHVALGIPSDADPSDDVHLDRRVFAASYDPEHAGPSWVAWRLVAGDLGDATRATSFRVDDALPLGLERVRPDAFEGSGWDRGHLCPSADRSANGDDVRATFVMTNVLPQLPTMNRGSWARLEAHTRALAEGGRTVYVVAGAVWGGAPARVGPSSIPERLFKVVVASEGPGVESVSERSTVIAVLVRNDASVKGTRWMDHQTTVDAVEEASGYDLLAALPDPLEAMLEARAPEAPGPTE